MTSPANAGLTSEYTDLRNSEKFAHWFGQDVRYIAEWDAWLVWDGKRFFPGECKVWQLAKLTARRLFSEATSNDDREWAHKSQSRQAIKSIVELAKTIDGINTDHKLLDSDPMLLNVRNGTIDLRTGKIRAHNRADLITKIAHVDFDPRAKCPTWDKFLARVMNGNPDMIAFLQRWGGYCLTGLTLEHALAFFYGKGSNGKSTFTKHVARLLGEYAVSGADGLLFASGQTQHPTSIASLYGARLVTCPEIPEGQALNEARVKDMTGGDVLSTRRMRQDYWEYLPTFKLVVYGNHKPVINGTDEGIWRRILLVPCEVKIKDDEKDPLLDSKIDAERSGLLNFLLAGLAEYLKIRLAAPPTVQMATNDYRKESDRLSEFFSTRCLFGSAERSTRAEIRKAYDEYCEENGITIRQKVDAKEFAKNLRERGCEDTSVRRDGKVRQGWAGVRLMTDSEIESRPPQPTKEIATMIANAISDSMPPRTEEDDDYDRAEREAIEDESL